MMTPGPPSVALEYVRTTLSGDLFVTPVALVTSNNAVMSCAAKAPAGNGVTT